MQSSVEGFLNALTGRSGVTDAVLRFAASEFVIILVPVLVSLWFWPGPKAARAERQRVAIAAVFSAGVALMVGLLISRVYFVARPFAADPSVHLLIPHAPDASMPSDHALMMFAVGGALFAWDRRAGLATVLLAAAVGFARVVAGLHWPTDVLAGALIGGIAGWSSASASFVLAGPQRRLAGRLPGWLISGG